MFSREGGGADLEELLAVLRELQASATVGPGIQIMTSLLTDRLEGAARRSGPSPAVRGLVVALATRGEYGAVVSTMLDLLHQMVHASGAQPDEEPFGRYRLLRRLPAGDEDECWLAEDPQEERPVFLRRFPRERMTGELVDLLKALRNIRHPGLTTLEDFGVLEHRPYLISTYVRGVHFADLARILDRRRQRLRLPLALALFAEGRVALEAMHAAGIAHGHLTAPRVRVEPLGRTTICAGPTEPPRSAGPGADLCALGRIILGSAVRDRQILEVLQTDEPDALVVAADRLMELHPKLDMLIRSVLVESPDLDAVEPLLESHVPSNAALSLIGTLVESAR